MVAPQRHLRLGRRRRPRLQVRGQHLDGLSLILITMAFMILGQPFGVSQCLVASVDDVEERALDLLGDRPARDADLDAVELADRRDLGGGAGEGLVADVDLVARDALLDELEARSLQIAKTVLRVMPLSAPADRSGRIDDAALDDEQVLARAFGTKPAASSSIASS